MSETPSLIPHVPFLSNNTQSTLIPDPFKILARPNLLPKPTKILANLLPNPSKILLTNLLPDHWKILPSKLLPDPSKFLPDLLPNASTILPNLLRPPSKILSTLLSSAKLPSSPLLGDNSVKFILGKLNPEKLLGLFTFLLSLFSWRCFLIIGVILLLFIGLMITGTMLGQIILMPTIILLSPILVPASTVLFIFATGFLSVCRFSIIAAVAVAWLVQRFCSHRAHNSPGSDRLLSDVKDAALGD